MEIAVIGAGAWGTALSILLSKKKFNVRLWEKFPDYAKFLDKKRENVKFLPKVKISKDILISSNIRYICEKAYMVIFTTPSHILRKIARKIKRFNLRNSIIVSGVKGIENKTNMRMSEVIRDELGSQKIVVMSGPSHAEEVVRGLPTAVAVASKDRKNAKEVQKIFSSSYFRVYINNDVIGVELGGALKNVIAIAAGVSDGLKIGDNAKAAVITRGLAEISRLGVTLGARPITFAGLSGIGDLFVTCTSRFSRNRMLGEKLSKGNSLRKILSKMEMVAEGVKTTKSAFSLSKKYGIYMPITKAVHEILFSRKSCKDAISELLSFKKNIYEFDFLNRR